MKSGDILEFGLGGEIPKLITALEAEEIFFHDDALDILKKTKRSPKRKCRVILLDGVALGFSYDHTDAKKFIQRGLSVGHKLCHPEVVLHLRKKASGDIEDLAINVAMKGFLVGRSELAVLSVNNDGTKELGEEVDLSVGTKAIAYGFRNGREEESCLVSEIWAFELA